MNFVCPANLKTPANMCGQYCDTFLEMEFRITSYPMDRSGRRGGLMVSALDLGASGPGSSPGRGHCVVFLGKTLYSHGASLHPGV